MFLPVTKIYYSMDISKILSYLAYLDEFYYQAAKNHDNLYILFQRQLSVKLRMKI